MASRVHVPTLVLCALVTSWPIHVAAQAQKPDAPPAMSGTVLPWWDMITASFVSAADAMPEASWSFAPRQGAFDGARTFAEQVKHVACANVAFFNEIEKKTPPDGCEKGGPDPARSKAEIVRYLRESFAYGRRVIETMTPQNALDPAGGPYGGQSTRLGLTTLAIWHASDHYGQVVVYLRMNGVVPPASRPR
jgi:uncharacterized damage-inducible protein DinB